MKIFLGSAICLLALSNAGAGSVDSCPKLPADSGLEWTYHEGPDFDVCYASLVGTKTSAFGIYLGNHASFSPKRSALVGKGKVAGQRVKWYRQGAADGDAPLARETLLTLNKERGYVAHIWVAADTEQQLQDRLAVLEAIEFKQ